MSPRLANSSYTVGQPTLCGCKNTSRKRAMADDSISHCHWTTKQYGTQWRGR